MPLTTTQIQSLDTGLNEATLLGVEVDSDRRLAGATFAVLTLPEIGPAPADPRVQFIFWPVGRVMASLRMGHWDDRTADLIKFEVANLLSVVQSFGGMAIYGWKFFDVDNAKTKDHWANGVSLDYQTGSDGLTHTLDLFQGDEKRSLELRLWFDELRIRNSARQEIPWEKFAAGGKRWWDGLYGGDARTKGFGIFRLK